VALCRRDGGTETVQVSGPFTSNNPQLLLPLGVAGHGLILWPSFAVGADILAGGLVPLLTNWRSRQLTIRALYPHRARCFRQRCEVFSTSWPKVRSRARVGAVAAEDGSPRTIDQVSGGFRRALQVRSATHVCQTLAGLLSIKRCRYRTRTNPPQYWTQQLCFRASATPPPRRPPRRGRNWRSHQGASDQHGGDQR
jgi:hypothetical protein